MAAFLATVILAMRLAVLYPHPKVEETSETIHPEMVVILQNLGEATEGLKIELGHKCDSNDKFIHLIGSKPSFPQSFLGANSYLPLSACSMLPTLLSCSNYLTGCRHVSNYCHAYTVNLTELDNDEI